MEIFAASFYFPVKLLLSQLVTLGFIIYAGPPQLQ
jgi:hypothetical protein